MMRQHTFWIRAVLCGVFLFTIFGLPEAVADDATIEGVVFEDSYAQEGLQLTLRGSGLLRYMIFYKAYVGAFYLEESKNVDAALEDVGRRLVLHYFHPIKSEDFAKATIKMIKKNVSQEEYNAIAPQIEQMNTLYQNVQPGDQYAATYIPGKGMELALNNQALGTVPGREFSKAYFSIWLGKQPVSPSFRNALLGSDGP